MGNILKRWMTVLLFNCFIICLWGNEVDSSFTGEIQQSDSTKVIVPISIIKEANVKLHERIILKDIVMNLEDKVVYYQKLTDTLNSQITKTEIDLIAVQNERDNAIDKSNFYKGVVVAESIVVLILGLCLICN